MKDSLLRIKICFTLLLLHHKKERALCPFFFMHREAGGPPPEETRRIGTNLLGRGARVSPAGGTPLGVSAEPCCPHHVETRRISQHPTERLSDVCFYVGFSFSQKVLRYFLGAL